MIDLQSFNESLKIKSIKGYLDDNNKGKWKSFVNHYLEKHGGKLVFSANLKLQDAPLLNISDPFLAKTVEYWTTLNYSKDNLNFPFSQIWLNSLIRIDNNRFFYKSWFHAGVKDVKDLLDDSNYNFLSYTAFITKYNIKTNYRSSLWLHKLMLIYLRIRPYESTRIDILATIMSLFLCHTTCNIWISLCTK